MGFAICTLLATAVAGISAPTSTQADSHTQPIETKEQPIAATETKTLINFDAFTGKITGSRLRVRLQPSLDGIILEELNQGDLVVVTDEVDNFFAVKPDSSRKGYIYRAYVLDNVVEANNVNLRLSPDTHAPVLCQLNQGDHVVGAPNAENPKWLEVSLPETVRFYVSKEYIANVGDASLYKRQQTRKQQLASRLDSLEKTIHTEMSKSFADIQLVPYVNELKTIVAQNQDLPQLADRAQLAIKTTQDEYLQMSLSKTIAPPTPPSTPELLAAAPAAIDLEVIQPRLASFSLEQQENSVVEQALKTGRFSSKDAFYTEALKEAQEIAGQLVPYDRPVKNRPGDFMLVDSKTKVPVAYIYSCNVNLHPFSGQVVRLMVSPRPNHHFALPAYVVLDVCCW